MQKSYVISITGPSGVGKTTLTQLIKYLYTTEDTVVLSGDDLHKWERLDSNWKSYTHFNPEANYLERGRQDLKCLKEGGSTYRRKYNHDTGKFDQQDLVESRPIIINEGLHTLLDKESCDLSDLKVYIDTDDQLTEEWKIKRDIYSRGYTEESVKEILQRRKADKRLYIEPQISNADVILKFTKDEGGKIALNYTCIDKSFETLFSRLKQLYADISNFLHLIQKLSTDINLTQDSGGNVSVKSGDLIIIKSSGISMSRINFFNGFCICKKSTSQNSFDTEQVYNDFCTKSKISGDGNPSMEFGFHTTLKNKVVLHAHPIHLNTILCSKFSRKILSSLFNHIEYTYIDYVTPGYKLANVLTAISNEVIFLENHGLIVSGESWEQVLSRLQDIDRTCKEWLDTQMDGHRVKTKDTTGHLFPDSAVFEDKLEIVNTHILNLMSMCYLTPKFLTQEEVAEIQSLHSEKLRKARL